jgi:hypothetical protein
MKFFEKLNRWTNPQPANNVPVIDSLKSDELWKFVQKPQGDAEAQAKAEELRALWLKAQQEATEARSSGNTDWAISGG